MPLEALLEAALLEAALLEATLLDATLLDATLLDAAVLEAALLLAAPPAPPAPPAPVVAVAPPAPVVVAGAPPTPVVLGFPPAPVEVLAVVDAPAPLLVVASPEPVVLPLAVPLDGESGDEQPGARSSGAALTATRVRMAVSVRFVFKGDHLDGGGPPRRPSWSSRLGPEPSRNSSRRGFFLKVLARRVNSQMRRATARERIPAREPLMNRNASVLEWPVRRLK
ncbi:MAG: hypothetical protein ABJE95_08085 [Byssovorax sp.]